MSSTTQNAPDIPDRQWTNPFVAGTPLHTKFERIVSQNRDIIIILDDYHANRGTGKTIASLQLANGMDQTDEGVTVDKVSLHPEEIREAYAEQPPRSGLVIDEAEVGASNRQAMSKVNQALREIMSMGRVEQKYCVVNAPAREFIDKDIQKLADVWITITRKGRGLVHFLERQPYTGQLLTPKKQWIEFEDVPGDHELRDVYHYLTKEKRDHIRGEGGDGYISREEHQKVIDRTKREIKQETRDNLICNIYEHPETNLSQRILGEAAGGLTQQAVGNIIQRNG